MTIKVRLFGDKATVRFGKNPAEAQWFRNQMVFMRDSNPKMHPQMTVRDDKGHVPQMPKPKPLGKPIIVPKIDMKQPMPADKEGMKVLYSVRSGEKVPQVKV